MESKPVSASRASVSFLAAVLLLSATGLMFEITLTRIFSATIWYHYTFVAISVALFGWGLGGFLVYLAKSSAGEMRARVLLVVFSLLLAVTLPLFPCGILRFPFTPERLNFYFLLSVLPFLAGGAALSLAFERYSHDINRLYFADLVGAALGTLMVPVVLACLGAETAVFALAVLPALAAVLLARSVPRYAGLLTGLAILVLIGNAGLTTWNLKTQTLTIRDAPEKALYKLLRQHPQARVVSDRWNAYSRITAAVNFDNFHVARLFIDSDAETSILKWTGSDRDYAGTHWFRAFPFTLVADPRVLVIGPGGGTDVVLAILNGSPEVTAVEMNPLIVQAVRRFGPAAGNLYDHPKVKLVMDEGRNFIQRSTDRFDFIVLGFVDSWASVSSGGLSLTENYLYTAEALRGYYDRLTDRGALVIVRWPVDVPRLTANAVAVLTERGMSVSEAGRHILAVSDRKPVGTEPVETIFMLSKSPLDMSGVDKALAGFPRAYRIQPSIEAETPYAKLFGGKISFAEYTDSFTTMATPVRDDKPFYFAWDKPVGIPSFAVRLLVLPVSTVIGFAGLVLIGGRTLKFQTPSSNTVLYFGALGLGFIVTEIALMQRLILLLGHPVYTLVVILFTLLLAGGAGSLYARRFDTERIPRALGKILPLVVLCIILGALALPYFVRWALPFDVTWRILIAGAIVFPFGFLMGMPFPLGLRDSAQRLRAAPVSVLWGINGVASVVGSVGAMFLAVAAGFTTVFLVGALCYAVAFTCRPRSLH